MVQDRPLGVAVLGSTGSIGRQTLDVIARSEGKFRVAALCAHSDDATLSRQIARFRPAFAGLVDASAAERLAREWEGKVRIGAGAAALTEAVELDGVDVVVVAVVGFAGVRPTLRALELGRRVALANKETLVAAGEIVMALAREKGALLPVDSEHAALFQAIDGKPKESLYKVTLTASGGPFRNTPLNELKDVTPEQALQHPTWKMGGKITVDSATLMNKGLEVIEAVHLFGLGLDQVGVVVHPQSLVHALVEYTDGSVLAQMAVADMRLPIAQALWYPERSPRYIERLDLTTLGRLEFEAPDTERFPCLALAVAALQAGGTMPCVLNAANEVAVTAFLQGRLGFMQIPRLIEEVMERHRPAEVTLENVFTSDAWARYEAARRLAALTL